jgi:hypothetical protein
MKKFLFAGAAALLLAGCQMKTSTPPAVTPETPATQEEVVPNDGTTMVPEAMTITLAEQSDSGQYGTATLEEKAGKVVATLSLVGSTSTVAQPAHIHVGKCPTPGAVKFPLTDVVGNKSVTTIDTTLAELREMGELAINVHKSATESKVYTSCGDVK